MSIVGFSGQSPRFSPLDIPGCTLWLDAADRRTLLLSGSNVSVWYDKSGNGHLGTGVNGPTFNSASNGVTFSSNASQYMKLTDGCLPTGDSSYAVYIVFTPTSRAQVQLLTGGANDGGRKLGIRTGNGGSGAFHVYWIGYDIATSNLFTANERTCGATYYTSGGSRTLWLNFVQGASDTPGVARNQPSTENYLATLGPDRAFEPFDGQFHEVLVYSSELMDPQRRAIEAYLARKWGMLSSLPSNHPGKTALTPMRPFSPVDVPGCTLWLDAADSTTLTLSGSNVTQWVDKSGNGNNARPFGTGPTRGVNAVTFSGTQTMDGSATYLHNSSNGTWTVFSTFRPTSLSGDPRLLHYQGTPNRVAQFLYVEGGSLSTLAWLSGEASLVQAFGGSLASNTSYVVSAVNTTSNLTAYRNGVAGTPVSHGALTTISNGRYILGGLSSTENRLTGDVYELLVYSNALSDANRQQVEGYLADKWGLRGSMGGTAHPYRYGPWPGLPTQFSGLTLWLDAADESSFTLSGSNVTQWRDKSSNAYTGTASGTPTRVLDSGYWAVRFNGTDQYFNFGDSADLGSANMNIFAVSKFSNTTGGGSIIAKTAYADAIYRWSLYRDGGSLYLSFQGGTLGNSGGANFSDSNTTRRLLSGTWDRATITSYQNGTSAATSTYSNTSTFNSTHSLLVGAYNSSTGGTPPTNGYYLNGSIHELVCIFGSMTAAERQQMEGYLAWKWGTFPSLQGISSNWAKLYRSLTPVFTPLQSAGLTLWLDAADTGTQTFSNTSLTQWTDKSGMGYTMNTAPTGNVLPVRGNAINGLSTIGITTNSMAIKQSNVINGVKNIFWIQRVTGGNSGYQFYFGADSTYDFHTGDQGQFAHGGFSPQGVRDASLSLFLSGGVTTGTMSTVQYPGANTLHMLSVSNMTGDTRLQGLNYDRGGGTRSIQCEWGELLLYTTAVPAADIKRIEGYLAWKWGMTAYLPSNHPFKLVKP